MGKAGDTVYAGTIWRGGMWHRGVGRGKALRLSDVGEGEKVGLVEDTTGWHDTVYVCSDACLMRDQFGKETYREARHDFYRNGKENFLIEMGTLGFEERDITCAINFFTDVPATPEGKLTVEDGISAPGRYVGMRADMDVSVLTSNCPQRNNPCNGYNPTPAGYSFGT
ncbi:MAG: DUF1989 domain-containing protein [Verrucomicrobiota bacterium]